MMFCSSSDFACNCAIIHLNQFFVKDNAGIFDKVRHTRIKTANMSPPMVETPPIFAVRKRKKIDAVHLTTDSASPPVVKNTVNHNEVTHNLRLLKSKANWM